MSAFTVVALWVVCALLILLTFVGMSIWYRRSRVGRPVGYKGLKKINAIAVFFRLAIIAAASAGVYRLLTKRPGFQSIILAPSLWACIAIVGYVILDLLMMGHSSSTRVKRVITTYIPGRLLLITFAYLAGLVVACWFTGKRATPDGKTYVAIWLATDGFQSARRTPFVGLFYTVPLVKSLGVVVGAAILGMIIVSLRRSYLPQEDYILLDRTLRRRVTRDIVLALLLAVSASLLIVCVDVVWAVAPVGPDNPTRVAYVVAAIIVGLWMFVTACWAFANLIFLISPQEDWNHAARPRVVGRRAKKRALAEAQKQASTDGTPQEPEVTPPVKPVETPPVEPVETPSVEPEAPQTELETDSTVTAQDSEAAGEDSEATHDESAEASEATETTEATEVVETTEVAEAPETVEAAEPTARAAKSKKPRTWPWSKKGKATEETSEPDAAPSEEGDEPGAGEDSTVQADVEASDSEAVDDGAATDDVSEDAPEPSDDQAADEATHEDQESSGSSPDDVTVAADKEEAVSG